MCLAYPGTVISLKGNSAKVSYSTEEKNVLVGDKKVNVGDKVLVQMGVIIEIISEQEAQNVASAWEELS